MYLKGKGFFYRKKKHYWKRVRYGKRSPYNSKSWKYNGKLIKL